MRGESVSIQQSGARQFLALICLVCAIAGLSRHAHAGPPVSCKPGFILREAIPGDSVCVPPASKARVVTENARAALLWTPGPFGPKTCAQGFVWREAYVGDVTCVTPAIRLLVRDENALAASRRL